jgi:hypothetical protein
VVAVLHRIAKLDGVSVCDAPTMLIDNRDYVIGEFESMRAQSVPRNYWAIIAGQHCTVAEISVVFYVTVFYTKEESEAAKDSAKAGLRTSTTPRAALKCPHLSSAATT